ncbi:hypothetical protein SRB5_12230 [Streptomyces sp. RB5]|uniref:Uncharacterized protein n=1 Tax=Streptomyces smaragdinus TaxID=2585196 RepID=A0A7K0CCE4_9ACTN|nr:hypothetical protein [Streptomyces smaragdinus]MQY11109.1 hypothetical protein [Streptomyces smaragdinus]
MDRSRQISPLVVKVLITLIVGGLTYLVTNGLISEDGNPNAEASRLIITIFFAGAAMIVQYMAEFDHRLQDVDRHMTDNSEQMKDTVHEGFKDINEATRVFGALQTHPLPTEGVVQLVQNVADIRAAGSSLISDFARREIDRVATLMRELKADQVEYEGEDRDWMLGLTRCAAHSIDAISTEVDLLFWPSELGRRYLTAQREAARRGVSVRRLFIVDDRDSVDDRVRDQCWGQRELGFEVRVAFKKNLPLGADPMYGFIVFDQTVSYEVVPEDGARSEVPSVAATRLVLREDRVANRVERVEELWEVGVELEEL